MRRSSMRPKTVALEREAAATTRTSPAAGELGLPLAERLASGDPPVLLLAAWALARRRGTW